MSWGGGTCWVSELDPIDGLLIDHPNNTEFDTHSPDMHTEVAKWDGDEWSSEWFEGPALYKYNGYWYFFASYGNLSEDYTIRMGRGLSPTGPFYDKDGTALTEYDEIEDEYGNSILFGDEGTQLVPGHPHVWSEGQRHFIGYDYRNNTDDDLDIMGIRNLYFVNDWPTIWLPITFTFAADYFPGSIGTHLGVRFTNSGTGNSILAIDKVELSYTGPEDIEGDLNNDGILNILDVIQMVNIILEGSMNENADLNEDGNVDILDIILLVNMILNY